jgi:hypothetical protein
VTTDGATTPTVGGAGVEQVPAGQSALIPNRQIKPSAVSITSTGHRRATTS